MSVYGSHRVVVSGLGIVSSIGYGRAAFLRALLGGESGASTVQAFSTEKFPSHVGCEVRHFEPREWIKTLVPDQLGRSSQMAVAATRQALLDAALKPEELGRRTCDVVMGTTDGESAQFDRFTEAWLARDAATAELPQLLTAQVIADAIQDEFNLEGDAAVVANACSAGNYAIGYGFDKIREGEADRVICGGSDAQCLKNFGGFHRIGALAPERCQPFDLHRKGILPGEGAAVLILERRDLAIARGARIYAEVLGYGTSCDGYHVMSPNKDGIVACNVEALDRCGLRCDQVDYICAHGTATASNDVVETKAMREVFGSHLPPMSSIKSMLGHTMGAASAFSAAACVLALEQGFMPPTIHFADPDPECAVDCVPNASRSAALRVVQNNAFAFGGNNAIVMFGRYT